MTDPIQIFVEGPDDHSLIAKLLEDLSTSIPLRFHEGAGVNSIRPRARKSMLLSRNPVVVVVDADTPDPKQAAAKIRELNDYLAWGAGDVPFKIVQFVPEIEIIFFDCPEVLRQVVGQTPSPDIEFAAKVSPKEMLMRLSGRRPVTSIVGALDEEAVRQLRQHPLIRDLRQFVSTQKGTSRNRP